MSIEIGIYKHSTIKNRLRIPPELTGNKNMFLLNTFCFKVE